MIDETKPQVTAVECSRQGPLFPLHGYQIFYGKIRNVECLRLTVRDASAKITGVAMLEI